MKPCLRRALLLVAVVVLAMSVCVPLEAASAKRTKVQVVSWWDFTTSQPLKQLKAKFEELNPDLELEYLQVGSSGYADKILVMIAGGADLPDVMMLAMDKIPIFASRGAIVNLDKFIQQDYKEEIKRLYPVVADALTYDGSYYAMPRDITSKVMFFNKQMFDKEGIAIPGPDWTWADFESIARKMTKDTDGDGNPDQWGFYFRKYMDGFTHWLMQNGGGLATKEGKSLIGKPETVEALKFLQRLIVMDKVIPTDTQARQFGSAQPASFIAGKAAMLEGGLSITVDLKNNGVDYVIRPLPKGKYSLSTAFVNAWAIPTGAKRPELSWRIMKFFASKEAQEIVLKSGMGLPARDDVDTSDFLKVRPDHKYLVESLATSKPFPSPVYGVDFFSLVEQEFDLMWLGQRTVEAAVAAVEKKAADVLSGKF
jgi:multiple sugar transport system substrate-binding protein